MPKTVLIKGVDMASVKDITVKKPTADEVKKCSAWPIWTCEPKTFDYEYNETETCLILEGAVTVSSTDGKASVRFGAGDFVVFPVGLKCVWHVEKAVRKHYNFS
jgi:uncharacterized cupin superfamily protein